jgi:hypothetical protein
MPSYLLIILLVLFASCQPHIDKESRFEKVPLTDTTCLKEIAIAKKDIGKGKLFYCHDAGSLLYQPSRCEHEMDSLLEFYGIGYKNTFTSDVIIEGQTQGCYGDYMNEMISDKFGSKFIDSLLYRADSIYVSKNLNKVFDDHELETEPRFPGDTADGNANFNPGLQEEFNKRISYPVGYVKKSKEKQMAFANFNLEIDRFGKAKIKDYYFLFDKEANHKFEKNLKSIFEPLIVNTSWIPATIKKQNVNSVITTFIYFK